MASRGHLNSTGKILYESAISTKGFLASASGQTIVGTAGADGLRTAGSATMMGGQGDDIYYVYTRADKVAEYDNEGIDTIVSTASWYMLPEHVENLTVILNGGTAVGNGLDNIIKGGAGSQTLNGGVGDDVLIGGSDADIFVVTKGEGSDVIVDFEAGLDRIRLDNYDHLTSFSVVKANMTEVGGDVVLNLGGGETVTFREHSISDFSENDFMLALDMSKFVMTFNDEFDTFTSSPNPGQGWQTKFGFGRTITTANLTSYFSDSSVGVDPFSVENGVLTITAQRAVEGIETPAGSGLTWTSGMIRTYGTFAQQYGYFEMRAELPAGQGFWPAFWLMPADGSWPPEIDVVEMLGDDPHTMYATTHTKAGGAHVFSSNKVYVGDTSDGFHTYGVDWQADKITYYFDGKMIAQDDTPDDMHKPMYIIANLQVGGVGSWSGPTNAATPDIAQMKIDYIRAYQYAPATPDEEEAPPEEEPVPVPPINTAPTAGADKFTLIRGSGPLTIDVASLLANDSDTDGDALSVVSVGGGTHGTVTLKDGQVIFTAETGYIGDATFSYVVSDGRGGVATGQAVVSIEAPKTVVGAQYLYMGNAAAGVQYDFQDATGGQLIRGTEHADTIFGAKSFANSLNGGGGGDVLVGGDMKDTLTGGAGADILTGGGGDDTFIINKGDLAHLKAGDLYDIITDFQGAGTFGGDMIRFQGFTSKAALSYVGDLAGDSRQHIYQIDDGDYHAQLVVTSDGFLSSQKGDFGFYA